MLEAVCLAYNIYFEARGEPAVVQRAVAEVTLNRVKAEEFPDSICEVVYDSETYKGKPLRDRCQFSWYCDGMKEVITDPKAWADAYSIAVSNIKSNLTKGALFFHSKNITPYWADAKEYVVTLGNLSFYK